MRIKHKKPVIILMAVICLALVINIAAAETYSRSDSKEAEGYGTLSANIQQRGKLMTTVTHVSENTDRARLVTSVELLKSSGGTVGEYSVTSDRGATHLLDNTDATEIVSETPSRVYSAHNVLDGSTYEAQVIYLNFPVDTTYYD